MAYREQQVELKVVATGKQGDTYYVKYNYGVVLFVEPETREENWKGGIRLTEDDDMQVYEDCLRHYENWAK
jgi:hypothetical protein